MNPVVWWTWSLVAAGAVLVLVAVLLGLIIATAISIDRNARQIWIVGKQLAGNTVSIWILESIQHRLDRTQASVQDLKESITSIHEDLRSQAAHRS